MLQSTRILGNHELMVEIYINFVTLTHLLVNDCKIVNVETLVDQCPEVVNLSHKIDNQERFRILKQVIM